VLAALAAPAAAAAAIPLPDADPFYQAPSPIPDVAPGTILRARPVDVTAAAIPLGFKAWQLLYRTNDTENVPEAALATVILPAGEGPRGGRPLVSYQTAEDALTTTCAPSYQLRKGTEAEAVAMLLPLLRGFAVVVPDFEGPHSQWSAGVQEGHATLDAIRAAEGFAPAGLAGARTPVGMWGYSGGGHASAWAAELQPDYAPELNIKGVAYGGVAAYIAATLANLDGGPFAGILFGGAIGVSRAYPEMGLDALLNAKGKAMEADVGKGCIKDWIVPYALHKLSEYTTVKDPLGLPQVKRVIAKASLGEHRPAGPQYVYWAINDELNPISEGDRLVATYCRQGVKVDYHRDPASEHITLDASGAPNAVAFLADRFAGKPAPNACKDLPAADAASAFAGVIATRKKLRADSRGRVWIAVRNPNPFAVEIVGVSLRSSKPRVEFARRTSPAGLAAGQTGVIRVRIGEAKLRRLRQLKQAHVRVSLTAQARDASE
jgi:hypothetical protein